MLRIPEYYARIESMPDDPEGSIPFATQSEQANVFIIMFPEATERAMPYERPDIVVNEIHTILSEKQGLIEVDYGNTEAGNRYIYSIIKTLKDPDGSGVQYTLTCDIDFLDYTLSLQGFFDEIGMTGIRDNTILAAAIKQGLVGEHLEGWFQDPYDPNYDNGLLMNLSEQRSIDEFFPAHPLSMARELITFIIANN